MTTPKGAMVRLVRTSVVALVCYVVTVGFALAVLASRPKLLQILGWVPTKSRSPSELGLAFEDVEYRPGVMAWWIPAVDLVDPVAAVVIVHGLETSEDPRSTDPGPRLEIAAALREVGYSALVINLGYAAGVHPYTAGVLEADDIDAAVRWIRERSGLPVALIGMSAGGHSAVAAAQRGCDVFAVVTDGTFVDGAQVIVDQATNLHPLLALPARLAPWWLRMLNGSAPLDLADSQTSGPPMLHVHGGRDSAIDPANAEKLSAITQGTSWVVPGAEHVRSYHAEPNVYMERIIDFLAESKSAIELADVSSTD